MKKRYIFLFIMVFFLAMPIFATEEHVYSIVGSAELFGRAWDVVDKNTEMTLKDGLYRYVLEGIELAANDYEYKVVVDHSWVECYPIGNTLKFNISQKGVYTIVFTFNVETKAVNEIVKQDGISQDETKTIYLDAGVWALDGATLFAHTWLSELDNTNVQLVNVSENVYSVSIKAEHNHVLFVRMHEGATEVDWNTLWNKTVDLTIPEDKNEYVITGFGASDGYWKVYGEDESGGGEGYGSLLDSGQCGDNIKWEYYSSGVLKIIGIGGLWNYNLGGPPWWNYHESITTISLPDGLTATGVDVFVNCNITSISIPETVIDIEEEAFSGCKLTSLSIPKNVANIYAGAFSYCKQLTSITCNAVTPPAMYSAKRWDKTDSIEVFKNVDKNIPLYVPKGSEKAYKQADQWKDFIHLRTIGEEKDYIDTEEQPIAYTITVTANNDAWGNVLGDGKYKAGEEISIYAVPKEGYEFSTWNDGNTDNPRFVTVLSDSIFTAIFVENNIVPAGKRAIYLNTGGYWWYNNDNYYIYAWKDANNSTNIKMEYVADYLYQAYIDENYTSAYFYVLNNETFVSIEDIWEGDKTKTTIPPDKNLYVITSSYMGVWTATEYGEWTVYDESKSKLCFGYGKTGDVEYAIMRDSTLEIIGSGAMEHYSTMEHSSTTGMVNPRWYWSPWHGWSNEINAISLPEGLTTIGAYAFEYCPKVTTITIPSTVSIIGSGAFQAQNYDAIICKAANPPTIAARTSGEEYKHFFQNVNFSIPVYVPSGSVAIYKAADYWKDFTNIKAIGEGGESHDENTYISVAEAIERASKLADNEAESTEVTVKGFVVEAFEMDWVYRTQIFRLADDKNNSENQRFQAYHCYVVENGKPLPVLKGDQVLLTGYLKKYVNKDKVELEIEQGTVTFLNKVDGDRSPNVETISVSEALSIGASLSEGKMTSTAYTIVGYVTNIVDNSYNTSYQNMSFWIADTPNEASSNGEGALYIYNGMPDVELVVGDKITVTTYIQNYAGIIEALKGAIVTRINPSDWNPDDKENYSISVLANDARLGTVSGGGIFAKSSVVTLKAIPNKGSAFVKWSDNITANPRSFYASQNTVYIAYFKPLKDSNNDKATDYRLYDEKSGVVNPWGNSVSHLPQTLEGLDEKGDGCYDIMLQKVLIDGQIYIVRDGRIYTITGTMVK